MPVSVFREDTVGELTLYLTCGGISKAAAEAKAAAVAKAEAEAEAKAAAEKAAAQKAAAEKAVADAKVVILANIRQKNNCFAGNGSGEGRLSKLKPS